jgi:hypothetical protein
MVCLGNICINTLHKGDDDGDDDDDDNNNNNNHHHEYPSHLERVFFSKNLSELIQEVCTNSGFMSGLDRSKH